MSRTQSFLTLTLETLAFVGVTALLSGFADAQQQRYVAPAVAPAVAPITLGVKVVPDFRGLQITYVIPNSQAQRAGLEPGDVITAVGFQAVLQPNQVAPSLSDYINRTKSSSVPLNVIDVRTGLPVTVHANFPNAGIVVRQR